MRLHKELAYSVAESRCHGLGLTTETFINTPHGRMSVTMPNFVSVKESQRRLRVIEKALNTAEKERF